MQTIQINKTTAAAGLSEAEAERSRREHGENVLPRAKRRSFIRAFLANLGDPVIRILLGALCVNLIFLFKSSDIVETVGIAVSVFTATLISTLSERGSERAYERLEQTDGGKCRVRRREGVRELPFSEVAVGDIVLVSAGDEIPADGLIISGVVGLDQSGMTGENKEIQKRPGGEGGLLPNSPSSLLRGARVLSGEGEMCVCAVGAATMLGSISHEVQAQVRESPLKVRLRKLASQISRLGYLGAVLVALAYLFNVFILDSSFSGGIIQAKLCDIPYLLSRLLDAFTLGLTVVVMAVPEGLPMMIAVVLSSNVKRMVRGGVLVKKGVGIEAAGSMDLLFTDKTGTLTEGKMKVSAFLTPAGEKCGKFSELERILPDIARIFLLSTHYNTDSMSDSEGRVIGGNATDRALLDAVKKKKPTAEVIRKINFDSMRKYSAVLIESEGERFWLFKGAPEVILRRGSRLRSALLAESRGGARGVAVAVWRGELPREGLPEGMREICGVLLRDPVRKNAAPMLKRLHGAGIGVVMVTGDSRETAGAIASECGMLSGKRNVLIDSSELAAMSDSEVREILPRLAVVARALPGDKSRLVRIAQSAGRVTGMTGDGINDAPALRAADVGFAMGCGTAVAKDAGDIVILSDDLEGIANAVLYGRNIFKSIRKFICLQLVVNLSAVGISMAGPFIGIDQPVTVVQMLWLNIIMDTLGGLAFAGEAPEERIMREAPKKRDEPILSPYMRSRIGFLGLFSLGMSLYFLISERIYSHYAESAGDARFLTGFFAFFVFIGIFNCFNSRSDRVNFLSGITKNPAFVLIICSVAFLQLLFTYLGGSILRTVALDADEIIFSLTMALAALPAGILHTVYRRLRGKKDGF